MRNLIIFVLSLFVIFTLVPTVHAVTSPSFPSCVNPQGTLSVSYSEGTHGIVGNTATFTGSDAVYTLSDDTLTQCFCAEDGTGIQSNWWKVSQLSEEDIQVLKNDGWLYVPNGALWGLTQDPYMVKNSSYACRGGGIGGGDVLAASTSQGEVLGLASTGNTVFVVGVGLVALLVSAVGIVLRKSGK